MNKHLIFTIIAISTLCVACDKNKDNIENETSNPYPYLKISDIEVYYGMNISAAEELIFSKGYQGGYVSKDDMYQYYKGNDTIYFGGVKNNSINQVGYNSSLKVQPSEARGWLLHPTQTYYGKYTYKFSEEVGWDSYQSFVSQLDSSEDGFGSWNSEADSVSFWLWYEYLGIDGGSMSNTFAAMYLGAM